MAAELGVVMLETRFPRPRGDIGNPSTFAFPVRYRVVAGASPRRVVVERDASLLAPFIAAARALQDEGAAAIATSCGFLALFQRELQAALAVPLWSSSLLLVGELQARLGAGRGRHRHRRRRLAQRRPSARRRCGGRHADRGPGERIPRFARRCSRTAPRSTAMKRARPPSPRQSGSSAAAPRSPRSCLNAPTCRRTATPFAPPPACPCTTSPL